MRPGRATRASCGESIRGPERSWTRSTCPPARACPGWNPTGASVSSAAAAAAGRCASCVGPSLAARDPSTSTRDPDALPGTRAPAQKERRAEQDDVEDHRRAAARRAITQLRQEVKPTLAGGERQDVRERQEHEPADREDQRDRHPDIPGAAQTHAAAEIQTIEELIGRGEPEQGDPQSRRGGG